MSWYTDLVAVFTDDGGVWTVTSNWESARLFIDGVIQNSEIDETQRDKLTEFEIITYDEFFGASRSDMSAVNGGIFSGLSYSDDEKKRDIQSYSKALYNYVSSNNYPQQVQIVFKSLTDSTAAVVNQADSLGDTSIVIPSWIKWGAGAYLLFLVLKR
tara:strand:+ start:478 stop:948 length:471 start_codon:yes stop_codon:yes gene_type:complete